MFCASLQIVGLSAEYLNFLTLRLSDSQSSLDLHYNSNSCTLCTIVSISSTVQSKNYTLHWFLAALAALCIPWRFIHCIDSWFWIQLEFQQNHTRFLQKSQFYQISQFWLNFTILTKFHNFDQISQFWSNFTILIKFHNFDQISQFLNKFHNFKQISQFQTKFTISNKFHNFNQCRQCRYYLY